MTADLDTPQFFAADVGGAAAIDVVTLQNWIKRKIIPMGDRDRAALGSGSRRLFTLRTVLHIAVAAELVRNGIAAATAAKMAAEFAHLGHGGGAWREGEKPPAGRNPGHLYEHGRTLLIAYPGAEEAVIMAVTDTTPISKLFEQQHNPKDDFVASAIILDLSEIDLMVRARLGVDRG